MDSGKRFQNFAPVVVLASLRYNLQDFFGIAAVNARSERRIRFDNRPTRAANEADINDRTVMAETVFAPLQQSFDQLNCGLRNV